MSVGDYFQSHTVIYSHCFKSGGKKCNAANTSEEVMFHVLLLCLLLLWWIAAFKGSSVWGGFDVATETIVWNNTENRKIYGFGENQPGFLSYYLEPVSEKWNHIYNRVRIIKFKSKNSNRGASNTVCGAVGERAKAWLKHQTFSAWNLHFMKWIKVACNRCPCVAVSLINNFAYY